MCSFDFMINRYIQLCIIYYMFPLVAVTSSDCRRRTTTPAWHIAPWVGTWRKQSPPSSPVRTATRFFGVDEGGNPEWYQWIPDTWQNKTAKKTKRLGGSKALHLIWGIFCFAEAVFVFWCVFVVILVFPFSLFEIVLGWVHCFDFNTCERKALAKSNSKSQ